MGNNFVHNEKYAFAVTVCTFVLCVGIFLWLIYYETEKEHEKQSDILTTYQMGRLASCTGVLAPKVLHDLAVRLNDEDEKFVKDYLAVRGVDTLSTDAILFIHEPASEDSVEARFHYLIVTHLNESPPRPYCIDGGLSGNFPFNEAMYEKYKK